MISADVEMNLLFGVIQSINQSEEIGQIRRFVADEKRQLHRSLVALWDGESPVHWQIMKGVLCGYGRKCEHCSFFHLPIVCIYSCIRQFNQSIHH